MKNSSDQTTREIIVHQTRKCIGNCCHDVGWYILRVDHQRVLHGNEALEVYDSYSSDIAVLSFHVLKCGNRIYH